MDGAAHVVDGVDVGDVHLAGPGVHADPRQLPVGRPLERILPLDRVEPARAPLLAPPRPGAERPPPLRSGAARNARGKAKG